MTTTFEAHVTIHSDAATSIVQNCSVEEKQEEWTLDGMVEDSAEVVKTGTYKKRYVFSVTGSGDLTLATGTAADANLSLISDGITNILSFKYEQALGKPSQWTYSGNAYPSAS